MKPVSCLFKLIKYTISFALLLVLFLAGLFFFFLFQKSPVEFNKEMAARVSYSDLVKIVPGAGLPGNVEIQKSNNNLDIVQYNGRYYFSFRSAPTHFASSKTVLYVMSSSDHENWELETSFKMNDDLREPRFLVFKEQLFLYFFQGGSNPLNFEPQSMYVIIFQGKKGNWSEPQKVYKPGYVVWRAKEHNGRAYMSVYYGAGLYTNETEPGDLRLLVSDDGVNYEIVDGKPASTDVSAEEGEFEFDAGGNLWSTIRYEMRGGAVCFAPADALSDWDCNFTNYKYDSALMFEQDGEMYVVARRNVDGQYNKESSIPPSIRYKYYLVRYSATRKRTALYWLNKKEKRLEPLFDFPSSGDTAYAGFTRLDDKHILLYNYSSDFTGFDWNWIGGQIARQQYLFDCSRIQINDVALSERENTISDNIKPKLLLHACCAPCTTHVYKELCDEFDVTVFFFNPNIQPDYEYDKRAEEMKKLAGIFGYELIIEPYNVEGWFIATHGLESEPEGGARCTPCFRLRLERTAVEASMHNFDYFTTTLTVSPHKNAEVINKEGERSAARHSVKYLDSNFKKKDGYKKSCTLAAEYNLYRQDYCGCIFSLR